MKSIWLCISLLCLTVFLPAQCFSEEPLFQKNANEIVKELTRQPVRTFRTRGFNPALKERCIVVKQMHNDQVVEKTITVSETDSTPRVNLKIEFDVNSYAIRPESFSLLTELGNALCNDALKGKPVLIFGHTDSDGPDQYNLSLSLNRALSVKNYLLGNFSIDVHNIQTMGYGEAMPLVPNITEANKQMNRRVEVRMATN